jgi:purine-binding chemotaxis protein CheW
MNTTSRNETGLPEAGASCLLFEQQGGLFALNTRVVRQIHWLPELTVTEGMPPFISGVFDLHGELVPVVDLNLRFGHAGTPYRLSDSVIVIDVDHGSIGVMANEVLDLVDISPLSTSLDTRPGEAKGLVKEVEADGRIVMLLDHERLLDVADFERCREDVGDGAKERVAFFPHASTEERGILRQRAEALMEKIEEIGDGHHGLAVISMGGEYFGFMLDAVREFADLGDVVPVPCCPPHIAGNMNFRGDIVTLVDMRSELHLPFNETDTPPKVVISEKDRLLVGIPVDEIHDVIFMKHGDYRPVPAALKGADEGYVKGQVPYQDQMVTVIDLEAFLQLPELTVDMEA